jgi:hypothetical protein
MRFLDFEGCESYDQRMMLRALLAIVVLATSVGSVRAQSLADVARTEAARRKAVAAPSQVYTNENLRSDFTTPEAAPPAASPGAPSTAAAADAGDAKPAAADAGGAKPVAAAGQAKDQAYWSGRLADARSKLERSQAFAQALQNRIDMLWTDFVNRGDPVQQRAIEQDRNKALAELEHLKKEIDDNQKALAAVEDEARRAGVPPGWLRP